MSVILDVPDPSVVFDLTSHTVVLSVDSPEVQIVARGPQGIPGTSGAILREVVPFSVPSSTWVVDVGRPVDVVVVNSAGQVVWPGEIIYGPGNRVTLYFSAPFSGEVHCYT